MPNHTIKCKKCGSTVRYKNGRCAPCGRESSRRWAKANPEKTRERNRRWQKANPDKAAASSRKWQKANHEKVNAIGHRRRARMNNVISEPYDFKAICEHYGKIYEYFNDIVQEIGDEL